MAWVPATNDPTAVAVSAANWGTSVVTTPSGINPATYTSGFMVDPDYYVTVANQNLSIPLIPEGITLVPALSTSVAGMTQTSYPI